MRDQLADRVRDPLEQRVERLLGEHVVEDVGQSAVRLDERECDAASGASPPRSRADGAARGVGRRGHDAALDSHRRDAETA